MTQNWIPDRSLQKYDKTNVSAMNGKDIYDV